MKQPISIDAKNDIIVEILFADKDGHAISIPSYPWKIEIFSDSSRKVIVDNFNGGLNLTVDGIKSNCLAAAEEPPLSINYAIGYGSKVIVRINAGDIGIGQVKVEKHSHVYDFRQGDGIRDENDITLTDYHILASHRLAFLQWKFTKQITEDSERRWVAEDGRAVVTDDTDKPVVVRLSQPDESDAVFDTYTASDVALYVGCDGIRHAFLVTEDGRRISLQRSYI